MNIYKVSAHSKCGTYFVNYLQSVSVIAENEKQAIKSVKEWLIKEGFNFILPEKEWRIYTVKHDVTLGVFDYYSDSDY